MGAMGTTARGRWRWAGSGGCSMRYGGRCRELGIAKLGFPFTSNFCRPGVGRGPIFSRPQQVTKTWIPALEGDPIRGAGTTGILETQLSNTSSRAAFKGKTAWRVHQTLCIDLSHLKCFSPSRRNFYLPQISVAPAQAGAQFCSFQYAAKIRPRPAPGRQFCWCRAR